MHNLWYYPTKYYLLPLLSMECSGCNVCKAGCWLVFIGSVNWGLIGLGGFLGKDLNVVNMLLGSMPQVEWIVYLLIGLAALCKFFKMCKCCK